MGEGEALETGSKQLDEPVLLEEPRPYQAELLAIAKCQNVIIPLGTGSGKTLIATLVIKEKAEEIRNFAKRSVFLVPTVPLVNQQARQLRKHLGDLIVAEFHGKMNVDAWDRQQWLTRMEGKHVLVMTAQVFYDHHAKYMEDYNILVLDECHHASESTKHPYSIIIDHHYNRTPQDKKPRLIGLTASVINNDEILKKTDVASRLHEYMRGLEQLFCATFRTATDLHGARFYCAKPKIVPVLFTVADCSSAAKACLDSANQIVITLPAKSPATSDDDYRCLAAFVKELQKQTKKLIFTPALTILTQIGPLATSLVIQSLLTKLENLRQRKGWGYSTFFETLLEKLGEARQLLNVPSEVAKISDFSLYTTAKVVKLVEILKDEYRTSGEEFCTLVFVQERYIAYALSELFTILSSKCPELSFCKCSSVIGFAGKEISSNNLESLQRRQHEVLKRFSNKELNLLFCTNVLEEGIDIRQCKCVIRFDPPLTYRSFVQSKGRARRHDSVYYVLTTDIKLTEYTFKKYELVEERNTPSEPNVGLNEPYDPFIAPLPENAMEGEQPHQLSASNSIQFLIRYCQSLRSDGTCYAPAPQFFFDENDLPPFRAKVKLPLNAPPSARLPIDSGWMQRKQHAKQHAAFKAVLALRELGEVNFYNFLPVVDDIEEATSLDDSEASRGTRAHRAKYDRQFASLLFRSLDSNDTFSLFYLKSTDRHGSHVLGLITHSTMPPKLPAMELFYKADTVHCKLITARKIRLTYDELNLLWKATKNLFVHFVGIDRENIYFDTMKCGILLAPLFTSDFQIDWRTVNEWASFDRQSFQTLNNNNNKNSLNNNDTQLIVPCYGRHVTKSVMPVYQVVQTNVLVYPSSPFPRDYANYNEYYTTCHGLNMPDQTTPLLAVEDVSAESLVFLKPANDRRKNRKKQLIHFVPEFVRSLPIPACIWRDVLLLPSLLYRLNAMLLSYELCSQRVAPHGHTYAWNESADDSLDQHKDALNSAEQLKQFDNDLMQLSDQHMGGESYIAAIDDGSSGFDFLSTGSLEQFLTSVISIYEPKNTRHAAVRTEIPSAEVANTDNDFDFELSSTDLKTPRIKQRKSDMKTKVSQLRFTDNDWNSGTLMDTDSIRIPNPRKVIEALTCRSANDAFNLERYETLGDSFLKFATSEYFFCTAQDKHEGRLTALKMRQISNKNLCSLGIEKHLPQIMHSDQFEPRKTWLPPGFVENDKQLTAQQQLISDKSVADCAEALIGVYLLEGGDNAARQFMRWLGLTVLTREEFNIAKPKSVLTPSLISDPHAMVNELYTRYNLVMLENILQYTFTDKGYLVQAVTHPSYDQNMATACYQRLEFLGDALLDYLVTREIFEDPANNTPGRLTDVRSALVNNRAFGLLAVRHYFYDYFMHMSATLNNAVHQYIEWLENHRAQMEIAQKYQSDLDDIDIPKVLGDLCEALAGAIYIDSNGSLDAVWRVFYSMLKNEIDECNAKPPIQPVRRLYEICNGKVSFQPSETENIQKGKTWLMTYEYYGVELQCEGTGRNKKIAQLNAANHALRSIGEIDDWQNFLTFA